MESRTKRTNVKAATNNQKSRIFEGRITADRALQASRRTQRDDALYRQKCIEAKAGSDLSHDEKNVSDEKEIEGPQRGLTSRVDSRIAYEHRFHQYLLEKQAKTEKQRQNSKTRIPFYTGKSTNTSQFKNTFFNKQSTPNNSSISYRPSKLAAQTSTVSLVTARELALNKLSSTAINKHATCTKNQLTSGEQSSTIKALQKVKTENCCSTSLAVKPAGAACFDSAVKIPFKIPDNSINTPFMINQATDVEKASTIEAPIIQDTDYLSTNVMLTSNAEHLSNELTMDVECEPTSLSVNIETKCDVRRSLRKTRYSGSFASSCTVSNKKRRSKIKSRTSMAVDDETTVETKINFTCGVPFGDCIASTESHCGREECKENHPPGVVSSRSSFSCDVSSTPSPSRHIFTSATKRRRTMTPFELNVDLVKPPEVCFDETYPQKTPNSILKSKPKSRVAKTVQFNLCESLSSFSFNTEILYNMEELDDSIAVTSTPGSVETPKSIVKSNFGKDEREQLMSPFLRTRRSIYQAQENLIEF